MPQKTPLLDPDKIADLFEQEVRMRQGPYYQLDRQGLLVDLIRTICEPINRVLEDLAMPVVTIQSPKLSPEQEKRITDMLKHTKSPSRAVVLAADMMYLANGVISRDDFARLFGVGDGIGVAPLDVRGAENYTWKGRTIRRGWNEAEDREENDAEFRQRIKMMTFGVAGGMGPQKLLETGRTSYDAAETAALPRDEPPVSPCMIDAWFAARRVGDDVESHPVTPSTPKPVYRSSYGQSSLADASLRAWIDARRAFGRADRVAMLLHDEIVVERPDAGPRFACRSHGCPTRAAVAATSAPTCYTCGCAMTVVSS